MQAGIAGFAAAIAFWLRPGAAQAQPAEVEFSLEYQAPPGCPDQSAFAEAVVARSSGARWALADRSRAHFRVEISGESAQAEGALTLRMPGGRSYRRAVPTAPCIDVVSSMAVISGMVLDAVARGLDPPADPMPSGAPAELPVLAPVASPGTGGRVIELTGPEHRARLVRPAKSALRLRPGFAWGGTYESAVAPIASIGFTGGIDFWLVTESLLAPSFRVSGLVTSSPEVQRGIGHASFFWWALRASVCPIRWPARSSVAARPCVSLDWGRLRGKGYTSTSATREEEMEWLAVGGAARFEWLILPVLGVEFEAGVVVPTRHDQFLFRSGTEAIKIHKVPSSGATLALRLVARFP